MPLSEADRLPAPTHESLVQDSEIFESFIYTDAETAAEQLPLRQEDSTLDAYLNDLIPQGPPEIMKDHLCGVLFRHVATPNFEAQHFETLVSRFPGLHPIIFEYSKDKFTNRNGWKYSMAKLCFDNGVNKSKKRIVEFKVVIDINASNVKPISTLQTHWGEGLVDFHHRFFKTVMKEYEIDYTDISKWLAEFGPTAKDYYKAFLALFLKHGVLFEYFLLNGEEEPFTKEIIIPSLLEIYRETGYKPLIVRLHPRWSEGHKFWLSYPYFFKRFLDEQASRGENGEIAHP